MNKMNFEFVGTPTFEDAARVLNVLIEDIDQSVSPTMVSISPGFNDFHANTSVKSEWSVLVNDDRMIEGLVDSEDNRAASDIVMNALDKPWMPSKILSVAHLVGRKKDDVMAELTKAGIEVRVVSENGVHFAGTLDYRLDRVNLNVVGGIVIDADVG